MKVQDEILPWTKNEGGLSISENICLWPNLLSLPYSIEKASDTNRKIYVRSETIAKYRWSQHYINQPSVHTNIVSYYLPEFTLNKYEWSITQ